MLEFGLTPADFRARHFEKNVYLRRAALTQRGVDWSQLDELLYRIEPGEPAMRLFHGGIVPEHLYIEDVVVFGRRRRQIHRARFCDALRSGATLILDRLEEQWLPARRLCAEVSLFAGLPAMSNAYVSFGGRGTFGKHWDTHDVFAVQLIGRKRWQVFAPTFPLPLPHQTSDRAAQDALGPPVLDCVLEAGDMLYVPRGWWHQTIPLDEGSFHVSVGAYAATLHDFFMWASAHHLSMLQPARAAFLSDADHASALDAMLRSLAEVLRDPRVWSEFEREMQQRSRPSPELQIGSLATEAAP